MDMFSYVKRGYNPEEVDAYISTLEQVVKSYKDKDNAIKNAIISAQVAADNIVRNAQAQASEYKNTIMQNLQMAQRSINMRRLELKAFQDAYDNLLTKYVKEFDEHEIRNIHNHLNSIENAIQELSNSMAMESQTPKPQENEVLKNEILSEIQAPDFP